jgi:proteasome assembly chaperone (PAC2) family protein
MRATAGNTKMSWKITKLNNENLKEPVLIAGLPGIGNVGKICADFIIEELKAKKMFSFFSNSFPNSVFVNEKNLIELPSITMHFISTKKKDFLILTGDIQPQEEKDCYDFCAIIDKIASDMKTSKIITLGGIGLREEPASPKVFASGNSKKEILEFIKAHNIEKNIFGIVGPIMGVSGVLPGITKIPSLILLAETFGHPLYAGIKGARELLKLLEEEYRLGIDATKIENEMKAREEDLLKKTKKLREITDAKQEKTISYIG